MAINKAIYKQVNDNGQFDEIYFKTDSSMVEVLDSNKNSKGNLEDLVLKGKVVESGSILNLKLSGKYNVLGLSDMPSGTSANKRYALQVISIGDDINNPTLVNYVLYDDDGYIYYRTTTGTGKDSGWSSGGTGIQNIVNGILNSMGKVDNLSTDNKTLVGAINELNTFKKSAEEGLQDLNNKDFDSRYVQKNAPSDITANLQLQYGKSINVKYADDSLSNLIGSDLYGNTVVGDTKGNINLRSKGNITHNGSKVWTESNDGSGSGLDADYLGGIHSSKYVTVNSDGSLSGKMNFDKGIGLSNYASLIWNNGGELQGTSYSGNFRVDFKDSSKRSFATISNSNGFTTHTFQAIGTSTISPSYKLKGRESDSGFFLEVNRSSGEFRFVNAQNGRELMSASKSAEYVSFNNTINIGGKNLYIQKSQPTGSNIPVGSLWFETVL